MYRAWPFRRDHINENRGALIPVEERTCLVCKEDCIEHEQHFLMYCRGYTTLRRDLHSHISKR